VIRIALPYPPTVNTYWRHVGSKVLISEGGKKYRERIFWIIREAGLQPLEGRLSVNLEVNPPDKRTRDLDNLPKALLDALTHARLWSDDGQIDDIRIRRLEIKSGGLVMFSVQRLEADLDRRGGRP
jgi:crossover junction endodeoxyribonuclease RusA